MSLYHYTAKPFTFDKTRRFAQTCDGIKPRGLWLSVNDDWKRWCDGEGFNQEGFVHRTELMIVDSAKVLYLNNVDDIDRFTCHYRQASERDALRAIDWQRVAEEYQGIIIAPYQWERRLTPHTLWYYAWDCASGCVWDCTILDVKVSVTVQEETIP